MKNVVAMPEAERNELFALTAERKGLGSAAVVEKDFWVCWTLKRIFEDEELSPLFIFKGGTSLSKVFHLVDRFSEDIDLILDWRVVTEEDPISERSNTQQGKLNERMNEEAQRSFSKIRRSESGGGIEGKNCYKVRPDPFSHCYKVRPDPFSQADASLVRAQTLLTPDERDPLAGFLPDRIQQEKRENEGGTWTEHLENAVDYRRWHRFSKAIAFSHGNGRAREKKKLREENGKNHIGLVTIFYCSCVIPEKTSGPVEVYGHIQFTD